MGRFNRQAAVVTKTVNMAGGEAYQESPKLELVSILLTSFVQDQFYRSSDGTLDRLNALIDSISDKEFIAKAAVYARTKFGMRSISHVVAGELAFRLKGNNGPLPWRKPFIKTVIYRPDDITEILAYYTSKYGAPTKMLKKGIAEAFEKFDEYQLAKYRSDGKEFKLVDAVNLCHPKPTEKNAEALKKLVDGTLRSVGTWETKLTQAGQAAESDEDKAQFKKEAWLSLLRERKIGYFALLRNLRNIMQQAPEGIADAVSMLVDRKLIKKSLVLPFRYLVALREIGLLPRSQVLWSALSQAVDISCENIPDLPGRTLVALDISGSMASTMPRASYCYVDIAALFAAALAKKVGADVIRFAGDAEYAGYNPSDSIITTASRFTDTPGGATDFHSIFNRADAPYDRIVIFSDMQGWRGHYAPTKTFAAYKKRFNCDPHIYSIDLAGYGTLQFPERNVYCLAGFSEKIFDVMKLLEQDRNALISEIEKVQFEY